MSYNHVDINIMRFKVYTTTYLLLFFIFFFPKAVFPQVNQGSLNALSEERPIVEADRYVLEAEKNIQKNNNLSLALSNYDKAIEVFPQYAQIYIKRGIVKIQLGKYEEAINDFTLAISIEPKGEYDDGSLMDKIHSQKNAEALFYRGQVRNILDDYEKALNDYTESLKFNEVYNTNLSEENIGNKKFPNTEKIHEVYRNIQQQISRDEIIHDFSRFKYDGKSAHQVINDHFIELLMQKDLSKFSNPVKLIRQDPQTYSNFLEPKDLILYDENLSMKIDSLFNNNESFQRLLINNQIQQFESELNTKSTTNVFDSQINPTNYAKAYVIFNRFGEEALTDYTNIIQHYQPNARAQDARVITAFGRFRDSPQYHGVDIFQYAEERLRFD